MKPIGDPQMVPRSPRVWALFVVFAIFAGLLSFGVITTEIAASGNPVPWKYHLLLEIDGALTGLALLPFMLWFMGSYPLDRANWWRRVPLHIVASMIIGASATLLMWGSRTILFPMLGWGEYDYGLMRYRFPMEYQKQFVLYWAIYCVVALIRSVRRNQAEQLRASELEKRLTEARLDALKMQLNPHFLFNTLNMISSYVHDDPRLADSMIGYLSDFLRVTLRHTGVHEVALEQELEFLDSYLAIMKARFEDRLVVELEISEPAKAAREPHLLLQPLVENSIAHCTKDHERPTIITISGVVANGRTRLVIEDNGPGIVDDGQAVVGRGVGLSNTAARLHELYAGDGAFELSNADGGGLRVVIEIPFHSLDELETR